MNWLLRLIADWPPASPLGRLAYRDADVRVDDAAVPPPAALAFAWQRWLWRRNQFLTIDRHAQAALQQEAAQVVAELAGKSDVTVADLLPHRERLAQLLGDIVGDAVVVTASHYSPELILAALGYGHELPSGPVLDVGCGDGALLRHLHGAGIVARGIDREAADAAATEPPALITRADWLRYDYGQQAWATVLSHHGFSLFFRHAHLAGAAEARDYAAAYMRILAALLPTGQFVYYPSVPFFEPALAQAGFVVELRPLPTRLQQVAAATDPTLPLTATLVRR